MSEPQKVRALPPLVHIRNPGAAARPSVPPPSSGVPSEDHSGRAVPVDVVRRDLLAGTLARDTEVLFTGLGDWTPAHEIPELWVPPTHPIPLEVEAPADSVDAPRSSVKSAEAPRKKAIGAGAIAGAIGGAVALLALGAAAIYFVYFHYRPTAVQHLPKKCMVAARAELKDIAYFKPLKDRIFPAIDDATKPKVPVAPTAPGAPSLKEKLKANAGINIDIDVREVALCVYQDNEPRPSTAPKDPLRGVRALVAIGGKLRAGSIPGIFESIRSEPFGIGARLDGTGENAVIRMPFPLGPPGALTIVIGQAEDGTILFALSDTALAAAREQKTEEEARNNTGLVGNAAIEITIEHFIFGLTRYGTPSGPIDQAMLDGMAKVQTGHFALSLSSNPRIELSLEDKSETDAKETEGALRKLLEAGQKEVAASKKDWAGEHAALSGAKLTRTENRIDVRIDFRGSDVDRGAADLAAMIKDETSPLRSLIVPLVAYELGIGPKPVLPTPAASGSTSGSPSISPSTSPSKPPPDEGDD